MPRYFLRLSYKGTSYSGWQIQDNAVSVQEKLNQGVSAITGCAVITTGCGRTDTGVHAKIFYAHFDLETPIADHEKFLYQINAVLPSDISVAELLPVNPLAHARYDATLRSYEYFITLEKNPFLKEYAMYCFTNPDAALMNEACEYLKNYNNFSAFSKSNTQVKTNECKITHARWRTSGTLLIFSISADRFLRGMVRAIVGTMLDIGNSKISPGAIESIITSGKRSEAGVSVAPGGLYLSEVHYPYIEIPRPDNFPAL